MNFFQKVKRMEIKPKLTTNQAPTRIQVKKAEKSLQKVLLQHHPDKHDADEAKLGASQVVQKFVTAEGQEMNLNFRIQDLYTIISRHEAHKNSVGSRKKLEPIQNQEMLAIPQEKSINF